MKYFYFWIFFMVVSAIWHGYKVSKQTKDGFPEIIGGALGLLFSPTFLLIETLKFIPAAIVLYLMS